MQEKKKKEGLKEFYGSRWGPRLLIHSAAAADTARPAWCLLANQNLPPSVGQTENKGSEVLLAPSTEVRKCARCQGDPGAGTAHSH